MRVPFSFHVSPSHSLSLLLFIRLLLRPFLLLLFSVLLIFSSNSSICISMEELGRVDSVSESDDSTLSFLLTTDDSSTTSSSSGSSGEIPSALIDVSVVPMLAEELNFKDAVADAAEGREKCVGGRRNRGVTWGMICVQGRRKQMEDAVSVKPAFMSMTCDHVGGCSAPGSLTSSEISPLHFFGVYDGHGGDQVAKFCSERMHEVVAEEWDQGVVDGCEWQRRWEIAFSSGFERTDNEVLKDSSASGMVGSTAVVAVVSGCQIITSNCGDSRAVLFRGAQSIPLTVDQKPDREDELTRIEAEGGKVINWNGTRVFGVLAMSRAIGDWYLRPWIIPVPEITFMPRSDEDECLILASDGLWDVMSNDEVGEVARRILRRRRRSMMTDQTLPAQAVADALTEIAYGRNSSDNISIIVVDLKAKRKHQQRQ